MSSQNQATIDFLNSPVQVLTMFSRAIALGHRFIQTLKN